MALPATRVGRFVCLGSFGYCDTSTRARVREVARGLGVSRGRVFFWFPGFGLENRHGG